MAESIAALALLTSSETVCFKAAFSSSVKFDFPIASFLAWAAWSMAFLAASLVAEAV